MDISNAVKSISHHGIFLLLFCLFFLRFFNCFCVCLIPFHFSIILVLLPFPCKFEAYLRLLLFFLSSAILATVAVSVSKAFMIVRVWLNFISCAVQLGKPLY